MSDVASILDDTDTVDTPKQNVGQHRNNRKAYPEHKHRELNEKGKTMKRL